MKRRQWLRLALGAGIVSSLGAARGPHGAGDAGLQWRERQLLGFGTTLRLQAAHADEAVVDTALDEAVRALRRIERQMNLFDPGSDLSRLNREGRLDQPPPELLEVLALARDVSAASGGAFDVTVQPLWQCWNRACKQGRLPSAMEIAHARSRVDWRALRVEPRAVVLERPGMGVTLNGIAQGYAADRVRAVLAAHGITDALVDAGEYAPLGRNPQRRDWTLGVADPTRHETLLARLLSDGRCLATSGDDETCFTTDHVHHHILDPARGDSPPALSGVTVAARSGALADALTKVMFIAGPERLAPLAKAWDVDVLWVAKDGRWGATQGLRLV
jgi:thiamine biosynthesis lipoprotein